MNSRLAIVSYVGTAPGIGPNANGFDYDSDVNGDLIPDGSEYDRRPSVIAGKPWRSGAPNGAVQLQDALTALSAIGDHCTPSGDPSDLDGDGLLDADELGLATCPGLQPKFNTLAQCHVGQLLANSLIPDATDIDGDGVRDGEEFRTYGSDPRDVDTDNDGALDGDEVSVYRSDPLDPDTDADGLIDGQEVAVSLTDPVNASTDGIGCNDGPELGPNHVTGGDRNPLVPWDFTDVRVPAVTTLAPEGDRNGAVTLSDALAVLFYVGTAPGLGANLNGVDYDDDVNGDLIPDGLEYDRSASTVPGKPWRAGVANGSVTLSDVLIVVASVGDSCTP